MITVYTSTNCAYCGMVKKFLSMKNKEYQEVNIDNNPSIRQSLISKTGSMTAPITISNDKVVIGFKPDKLAEL